LAYNSVFSTARALTLRRSFNRKSESALNGMQYVHV